MRAETPDPTLATVEAVDIALPIAGIGSRSYAFLIDWHLRFIAAAAWFFGVLLLGRLIGQSARPDGDLFLVALVPTFGLYFLYHPLLEVLQQGRTPGKRIAGIRVVARDGGPAGTGAHLARNLFRLLDSLPGMYALGLASMIATRSQSRIGDLAAGTLVIYESMQREAVLAVLATTSLDPQLALLIDELLERWPQLDAARSHELAGQLLTRACAEPPPTGQARRAALQRLLGR